MIPKKTEEIKEKSVIEICIIRSKQLHKMRRLGVIARQFRLEIQECPVRFPSEDKLKDLQDEIKNRISEFEMSMAKLLKPILAPHGIKLEDKYWFSNQEIKEGYILFQKPTSLGASHVLFLRDHKDTFDGTEIKQGDIKLYKHVNHFLERLDADIALRKAQSKSK